MRDNKYNKWERITIVALLILITSIYILRLPNHRPIGDEGVIASWAWWHSETGEVKSDLHIGITETSGGKPYIYHKLFTLASSTVIKLFGLNIHLIRALSLLSFIGLLALLYLYAKDKKLESNTFLMIVVLLMFQISIFDLSWLARTDMLLITLGFSSFYFIEKALSTNKILLYAIAGSFAGIAVFAHLNGIIFISAGGILILSKKKILPAFIFGISALLFSSLFLYDIGSISEIQNFVQSIQKSPDLQSANYHWADFMIRILKEHLRFLHSESETTLTLLFLFTVIFNFKKLRTQHLNLIIYMFSAMIVLGAISRSSSFVYYASIYYPHMMVVIAISFKDLFNSQLWKRYTLAFFTASFLSFSLFGISNIMKQNMDITGINNTIGNELKLGSKVITNAQFVFNEINHFTIQGFLSYRFHLHIKKEKPVYKQSEFLQFCEKYKNEYIVFNFKLKKDDIVKLFDFESLQQNDTVGNYILIKHTPDYAILQHKES